MLSIIHTLLIISSFYWITLNTFLFKKRVSILYKLKTGQNCFNCKKDLQTFDIKKIYEHFDEKKNFYNLCTSCKRDIDLNSILEKKNNFKFKLKKFLLTNNNRIIVEFSSIIISIIFSCLWFIYGKSIIIGILSSLFLNISNITHYIFFKITSEKKM